VNHPEQAKRNRNTKSSTMSVPVGVKSNDILRVRSTAALSALSVAASYHAEYNWRTGSAGRASPGRARLFAGVFEWNRRGRNETW
jgi:hypothetical protein